MNDCFEMLKAAREAELEVQAGLEHIERIHRILKLPNRSPEYVKGLTEKLAAFEAELNEQIDAAVDLKRAALTCLSALHGSEKAVLYQYYILAKDWQKVSEALYISERQIFNIRKKALNRLAAGHTAPIDGRRGA